MHIILYRKLDIMMYQFINESRRPEMCTEAHGTEPIVTAKMAISVEKYGGNVIFCKNCVIYENIMSKCVTKIDSYDMISTGSRYPVWRKKGAVCWLQKTNSG